MFKPSVLFASACNLNADEIIEEVLNSSLPDGQLIDDNITAYKWNIDNKYYTADINLCSLKAKAIGTPEFADTVEAIVLCYDGLSSNGITQAESWLPFLTVYDNIEIKILLCDTNHDDDDVKKRSVLEWCIEKGFELVELTPIIEESEEEEEEDDFPETLGVERVRQALNAHRWKNLVLKFENHDIPDLLTESIEEILDGDTFDDYFVQLSEFKNRLQALSGDERKDAAEQFVRRIWNSMEDGDNII